MTHFQGDLLRDTTLGLIYDLVGASTSVQVGLIYDLTTSSNSKHSLDKWVIQGGLVSAPDL